ncbi:uncharacterized protein N7511_010692 [Penicillium nucicola]|uniref:uncharacterized protein n=1 Tax=Penicillium nucicola TaxID=1850975 RepID=UPI0025453488|nr:uncharacterized protein N7511_010692 [Penicillium nucicola]KAJ5748996.1 hypothetical protein N7511_010692 [Penicillium nucicola]
MSLFYPPTIVNKPKATEQTHESHIQAIPIHSENQKKRSENQKKEGEEDRQKHKPKTLSLGILEVSQFLSHAPVHEKLN